MEGAAFPGFHRVEKGEAAACLHRLIVHRNIIGHSLAAGVVIDAPELFQVRGGNFLRRFAQLDFGEIAAILLHRGQLVHPAEHRVAFRGDEIFPNAEQIHLGPLQQQVPHNVFVQGVGGADGAGRVPGLAQQFAGPLAEVGNVAGIDADAAGLLAQRLQHLVEHPNGIGHPAVQHAVGVHQKQAVVRVQLGIALEGLVLARKHLHPAVGHGARGGDAELAVGHHAAGGRTAANIGRARAIQGRVIALGAAGAKLQHLPPLAGPHHAAGLGGNQALVVEGEQQKGLDELGLYAGPLHRNQRLAGKDGAALLHRPHVAVEAEVAQILEKFL